MILFYYVGLTLSWVEGQWLEIMEWVFFPNSD